MVREQMPDSASQKLHGGRSILVGGDGQQEGSPDRVVVASGAEDDAHGLGAGARRKRASDEAAAMMGGGCGGGARRAGVSLPEASVLPTAPVPCAEPHSIDRQLSLRATPPHANLMLSKRTCTVSSTASPAPAANRKLSQHPEFPHHVDPSRNQSTIDFTSNDTVSVCFRSISTVTFFFFLHLS